MKNLFLTFLMLTGLGLIADDLYVNSSGLEGTYYTIQEAVNAASDGDNIYISTVGTYSEDVSIDKSLFLIAGVPNEYYTISGELQIGTEAGMEVTIIGMNNGSITGQGSVSGDKVTVNIISSFVSSIDFQGSNYNYEVNVYDCEVYNDFKIRNGQVKGNIIANLNIQTDSNSETDTIKVMGNYLNNIYYSSTSHYFEICNNFVDTDPDQASNNTKAIEINNFKTTSGGTNIIANNTIYSYSTAPCCSNTTSYGIWFTNSNDGQNVVIVNNYISNYSLSTYTSSYEYAYSIYSNYGDMANAYVANNYFYQNSTYGDEIVNFDSSSLIDNENTSFSYNSTTGILDGGENMGLDWIEYRDIDNTTNDIGTAGGPHAWSNYNTTEGKAAIFDLELPFQLYIGGVHSVKAKSFHKN